MDLYYYSLSGTDESWKNVAGYPPLFLSDTVRMSSPVIVFARDGTSFAGDTITVPQKGEFIHFWLLLIIILIIILIIN